MKQLSKYLCLASACLPLLLPTQSSALTVFDPTLIRTNLLNAKKDLLQQIKQEANQKTQIFKLERQIERANDLLRRMGNPEDVDLEMLREIFRFLKRVELSKPSHEIVKDMRVDEIFSDDSKRGPSSKVNQEIIVDGKVVGKRSGQVYAPEVAARRSLEHYRSVKEAGMLERRSMKQQLAQTLQAVQRAKTSSEVQKLVAVLSALQAQLAATDNEISFASNEVLTRYLHNQNEKEVSAKARIQKLRTQLRVGTEKDLNRYRLPSKPLLFPR